MSKMCWLGVVLVWIAVSDPALAGEPPFLGEGVKIGELTQDSAIIWTRLTKVERCLPETYELPGMPGEVKLIWSEAGRGNPRETAWIAVDPQRDFTHHFRLEKLRPATEYEFRIHFRSRADASEKTGLTGRFKTAPLPGQTSPIQFVVTTGHRFATMDDPGKGQKIYPAMLALKPDFFVHTGDIVYYDKDVTDAHNVAEARTHWHRLYSLPYQRAFHLQVPSYFIKDDHDTCKNDCWPGQKFFDLTFAQGQAIFLEQVPMGDKTYRTIRWGKDLQIWLVEGRDFRSPNRMPDGPAKTLWGAEQIAWFKRTVSESDATFRVLISPGPLVGPDRKNKHDNHANDNFQYEGSRLRQFISDQKNMVVICGDRHWQYVSVDPETHVREYSCGPSTDLHAGGWQQSDETPMHKFLRVRGGFLSAAVDRSEGEAKLTFRHHAVDGSMVNQDVFVPPSAATKPSR